MTDQYRAAPELWAAAEKWGTNTMDMVNCILELRSRIELLEATQHAHFDTSMKMPKQLAPMTDLSPAAQAVLTAIHAAPDNTRDSYRSAGAAVLRAAADGCSSDWMGLTVIHHLYAIADELEGN